MDEEFNNHMLRFQQVTESFVYFSKRYLTLQAGLVAIEVHFKESEKGDESEPLRMEHFYFPLGLWLIGTVLSVLCFIAEIFIQRTGKSEARLEVPGH